jgi:arylsulfatase A-like enzyme
MAVYAAQVDRMDQGVGKILAALEQTKQADNTLVIFLSDNGGCHENVQPGWYDIPTETRDGLKIAVGNDPQVTPGGQESFQSYGPSWAMASNTPFRRYKHYAHEGGIATPFIARWPSRVSAKGEFRKDVAHVIDVMPTVLEAASAKYPDDKPKPEGVSLLAAMSATPKPLESRSIFWEHEGNRAVRRGNFKLVAEHGKPWELYNLEADPNELKDLAADRAELVEELTKEYQLWADRVGVRPYDEVRARKVKGSG